MTARTTLDLPETHPDHAVFVASHGGFWRPCAGDAPGAEAFGPTGISAVAYFRGCTSVADARGHGVRIDLVEGADGWNRPALRAYEGRTSVKFHSSGDALAAHVTYPDGSGLSVYARGMYPDKPRYTRIYAAAELETPTEGGDVYGPRYLAPDGWTCPE